MSFSDTLLKETMETWQDCSREQLTLHEAGQICETVLGLFKILARIDKRIQNAQEASETTTRS